MTSQTEPIVPSRPRRAPAPAAPFPVLPVAALALVLTLVLAGAGPAAARPQDPAVQSSSGQSTASQMESGRSQDAQPDAAMAEEAQEQEMEPQLPTGETPAAAGAEAAVSDQPPAVDTAAGVMAADRALAQAVADGDADAFRNLLAQDAVFLSGQGALDGRDAVATGWAALMAEDRAATLTWDPKGARLATSRDLAYSVGAYTLTVKRAAGDPLQDRGQYITVWTRDAEADGPWKVLFDGSLRRGIAAYLERALGEQGRIGPKTGADLTFVPERRVTAKSDDLSVTYGTYQAQRIDLDGSRHSVAEGSWFSVWATNPEATPDEATRLLPAGDSITPPPPSPPAAETPAAADDEAMDGQ